MNFPIFCPLGVTKPRRFLVELLPFSIWDWELRRKEGSLHNDLAAPSLPPEWRVSFAPVLELLFSEKGRPRLAKTMVVMVFTGTRDLVFKIFSCFKLQKCLTNLHSWS